MRQKKFEYFSVCRFGLIGKKHVTRVLDQDEFCARNLPCDQLPVARGHQRIRLSMDDQRRRRDLSDSAVALPCQDPL